MRNKELKTWLFSHGLSPGFRRGVFWRGMGSGISCFREISFISLAFFSGRGVLFLWYSFNHLRFVALESSATEAFSRPLIGPPLTLTVVKNTPMQVWFTWSYEKQTRYYEA